jgi:hypothetical protein
MGREDDSSFQTTRRILLLGVSEFRQQGPAYAFGTPTPRRGTEGLLKQLALDTHLLLLTPRCLTRYRGPWPIELVLIMPLAAQRVCAKPLSARAENTVQLLFAVRVSIWHPRPCTRSLP